MSRFFAGFATASVIWGAVLALVLTGVIVVHREERPLPVVAVADVDAGVTTAASPHGRRHGRGGNGGTAGTTGTTSAPGPPPPSGGHEAAPEDVLTGDDLGQVSHTLDVGATGGEEHLTAPQIEQAFDGVLPRIRRCLILVPGEGDIRGRIIFGFRVAHDGHVVAVNLRGPSTITTGEPGDCLRAAGRGAHFPSFDGPDTLASYPLDLH